MIGFAPTEVYIDGKKTNAVIGISSTMISSDKKYNAIINPQTI